MPSIIEGYSYDIFISYRQKDNKHDGWVTEFVDNLKGELESTFKEEISVYFDINPHDGLLETHDVDASLKEKLKCLVFIPIISRTYCDPKSFAWEHEFKTFVEQASKDQFGLKVKLPNGNVANRILPVRIHDLDNEDIKLCESVLGGVLRGIEFIYKEPGVNKPLTADDDEKKNLNNTKYRIQINKVANAIKEVITAIKQYSPKHEEGQKEVSKPISVPRKNHKAIIIAGSVIALALIILGFIFIPKLFKPSEKLEKSIAIIPFKNDSPDEENVYFLNGIMEEILNNLETIKDLRVISRTSVEQYRNTTTSIPEIAKELGVNYIVEGSGEKYGNTFNLNVQLIKAADKESHLWAKSYEQEIKEVIDIFSIKRQIAQAIAAELNAVITPQEKDLIQQIPTNNPLAYDYYLKGRQYNSDLKWDLAIDMYRKAIEQDPEFALAYLARASLYSDIYFIKGGNYKGNWQSFYSLAKADLEKALILSPNSLEVKLEQANQLYRFDRNHDKALALLDEIKTQMPNNPGFFALRSDILQRKGKWEESLEERQKSILLDPLNPGYYNQLGHTYRLLRRYPEAMECYNKPKLLGRNYLSDPKGKFLTILLWKGDVKEALKISDTSITYLSNVADLEYLNYYYYSREYDKLILIAHNYEDQWKYHPRALILAQIYFLKGNISLSRQYADSAIAELILKVKEFPEDERYYSALGYAYAYKGEKKKAIENAQKALKFKPLKLDAWQGQAMEMNLAKIYILTGEYDLAMDKIEFLLTIPGDISVLFLKINPMYDKFRLLPRFQKILTTEYKTNY